MKYRFLILALSTLLLSGCGSSDVPVSTDVTGPGPTQASVDRPSGSIVEEDVEEIVEDSESEVVEGQDEGRSQEVMPEGEYAFESCGTRADYQDETFYEGYVAALTSKGDYNPEFVDVFCYSRQANVLIGLYPGDYFDTGEIFKYEIDSGNLTFAQKQSVSSPIDEWRGPPGPFNDFGRRQGPYIEVYSGYGDGGARSESTYHYYYDTNLVVLKEYCHNHVGGEEEFSDELSECTSY